jgi:hypothetical protein
MPLPPPTPAPLNQTARNVVLGLIVLFVLPLSGLFMWAVIRGSIAPSERIFLRCGITTVATMLFLFFTGCFLIQFKCNDYITLRKGESNAKRLDTVFRPDEKDAATNEPIPAAPTPTGQAVAALVDIETQEANAASPQFLPRTWLRFTRTGDGGALGTRFRACH